MQIKNLEKMDILVTRPPLDGAAFLYEDLGLEMITACLRSASHQCRYLDAMQIEMSGSDYVKEVLQAPEQIVCVGIHSEFNVDEVLKITTKIKAKAPGKIIILGGHPLYGLDTEIFRVYPNGFDYIVRGEGEDTIVELLRFLMDKKPSPETIPGISYKNNKQLVQNPLRKRTGKYDHLPLAARDIWENGHQKPVSHSILISLSRGCNYRCRFCSVAPYHGVNQREWYSRSIDNFFDEVIFLNRKLKAKDFTIVDPNFLGNVKDIKGHVDRFCRAIKDRHLNIIFDIACRVDALDQDTIKKMYAAGWRRVFVGIESGRKKGLDGWGKAHDPKRSLKTAKALAKAGVLMEVGFILLGPETTLVELREDLTFLKQLPYFSPRALTSRMWPIHASLLNNSLKEDVLVRQKESIGFSYSFKNKEIAEYYRIANLIDQAFSGYFFDMHWHTWDTMFDDPQVIKRYAQTMRPLLDTYQDMIDRIVDKIAEGLSGKKLDTFAKKEMAVRKKIIAKTSHQFK